MVSGSLTPGVLMFQVKRLFSEGCVEAVTDIAEPVELMGRLSQWNMVFHISLAMTIFHQRPPLIHDAKQEEEVGWKLVPRPRGREVRIK